MSSIDRKTPRLPVIKLDTTLTDLYKQSNPSISNKQLAHVHSIAHCGLALGPHIPRNTKFLYQDGDFVNTPLGELTASNEEFRRSLSTKYLSIVPQRDAFISGDSASILFDIDSDNPQRTAHGRQEVETTMSVLEESQKPRLLHCRGPRCLPVKESGIDLIAGFKLAVDDLGERGYPLDVEIEKHWFLNSKAALAGSGLPTPRSEILEISGYPIPPKECCDICRAAESEGMLPIVPKGCKGQRGSWVKDKEQKVAAAITSRNPPFVLKTQQTFGGSGTWIISDGQQKDQLLEDLSHDDGVVRRILSQVNDRNHHLQPGTIILSELVNDLSGNYGVTFFVTETGEVIFMGASEQILASDGKAWTGSIINYQKQGALQEKLQPVMEQTARWLNGEHGYHGPVGLDVLEKPMDATDRQEGEQSTLQIVDLNVRVAGSMSLPLLKSHFTSRELYFASVSMVTMRCDRWDFIAKWQEEFESGRMVILSWHYDPEVNISVGSIVVGGEDEPGLHKIIDRVRKTSEDVTF